MLAPLCFGHFEFFSPISFFVVIDDAPAGFEWVMSCSRDAHEMVTITTSLPKRVTKSHAGYRLGKRTGSAASVYDSMIKSKLGLNAVSIRTKDLTMELPLFEAIIS